MSNSFFYLYLFVLKKALYFCLCTFLVHVIMLTVKAIEVIISIVNKTGELRLDIEIYGNNRRKI